MTALSIQQAVEWGAEQISSDSNKLDARLLLCHVLQCEPAYLHTWPEKHLNAEQQQQFGELVNQRQLGQPIAYLLGYRDFWSLRLKVSPATLIPRPETELLVETALKLPLSNNAQVLDLGTGTGAIALALAHEKPQWQITGVDIQAEAIALAQQNAKQLGLNQVDLRQSDWFAAIETDQQFNLIVSNPPYVESHSPYLQQGDVRFEPLSALTSGQQGLDDILQIVEQASEFLLDEGYILFEHGFNQAQAVAEILQQHEFEHIQPFRDLNNLHRVTLARKSR